MKKIAIFAMFVTMILGGCMPNDNDYNDNNYNGGIVQEKIKTTDTKRFQDVVISANYVTSYITPNGFDYDKLEDRGYSYMDFILEYYVSYIKTWDSLDFLYNGAPKYDVTIYDDNDMGIEKSGLKTTKYETKQSISIRYSFVDLKNNKIRLEIGSSNIQNNIIFTDIIVYYKCR